MPLQNFLPLRREIREHWIYKDNDNFKVWIEMLFCARFEREPKTDYYKGSIYTINYSEFLYSRPSYSKRLDIPEAKLRTLVKNMVNDGMITKVKSLGKNKATIYKINNYEKYNFLPSETMDIQGLDGTVHQVVTKSQPSRNQVVTTKKERKKDKKDNNKYIYTLEFENFFSSFPRPQAKADTFKSWNTLLKQYTVEQLLQFAKNYTDYYNSIPEADRPFAYGSNNFFGKKAYYEDFIEPKAYVPQKKKPQQKPANMSNMQQRQYSKEDLDEFYDNV